MANIKISNHLPAHRPRNHTSQQGVVIVIALFVVALVATITYLMMSRLERDTRRTSLILTNTKAEQLAQGSIAWAIDQLRNDWELQSAKRIVDVIPLVSPVQQEEGFRIKSTIYDLQARFNINNLSEMDNSPNSAFAGFKRLARRVAPKLSEQQATDLATAIQHWVRPPAGDDSYAAIYQGQAIPYRPAHRFMQSVTELRLVAGMTPALYHALQPYIVALPQTTPINIQTADVPVFLTLAPNMTPELAQVLVNIRHATPFVTLQQFQNLDIVKNQNLSTSNLTTVSAYFLVETQVSIENQQVVLYTLLERVVKQMKPTPDQSQAGSALINIIGQSKGTW